MKKWLLVLLLLPCVISANDLRVLYQDSISAADSVAEAVRCDTAYSDAIRIDGANYIGFYDKMSARPSLADTNWEDDTFFVYFQHSWDKSVWLTVKVDTMLDNATGVRDEFRLKASDSTLGNWGRAMVIHWDSMEAAADIKDNVYYKEIELWLSIIR